MAKTNSVQLHICVQDISNIHGILSKYNMKYAEIVTTK